MINDLRLCADCLESLGEPREKTRLAYPGYAPKRLVHCGGEKHEHALVLVDESGTVVSSSTTHIDIDDMPKIEKARELVAGHSLTL